MGHGELLGDSSRMTDLRVTFTQIRSKDIVKTNIYDFAIRIGRSGIASRVT